MHVNFTYKKERYLPIKINNTQVPVAESAKYLGLHLDKRLRWKVHIRKKREELNIKYRKLYWMLGRNSKLSIDNKLLIYKQVLRPVWTYGAQLWGALVKATLKLYRDSRMC